MSINNPGGAAAPQDAEELEVLVVDIRSLGDMLKWRIRALERERTPDRDGQIRKQQVCGPLLIAHGPQRLIHPIADFLCCS